MKNINKTSLLILLTLVICAARKSTYAQVKTNFIIKGTLKNMPNMPAKIYLIYPEFLGHQIDSADVKNGHYQLTGYTPDVLGADLSTNKRSDLANPKSKFTLILDKGELEVVSTVGLDQSTVSGTGSAAHNEFTGILKKNKEEIAAINKVMATDQYKTDADFKRTTMAKYYKLISSSLNNLIDFARANPGSPVAPYVTYMLVSSRFVLPAMQDTLVQNIPAAAMKGIVGQELTKAYVKNQNIAKEAADIAEAKRKAIDEKIPIGTKAMEFTMNNTEGKPVSLSSFKGKYVLIDFWASWCTPCRAENPNVLEVYNTYKSKGFTVLGVSLDAESQKKAWLAAIKKDGLEWTQVSDLKGWKNEAAKLYLVESIPQNFLINPEGVIVAKDLRGDDLKNKLASLLK